jgi:hypothetical protein
MRPDRTVETFGVRTEGANVYSHDICVKDQTGTRRVPRSVVLASLQPSDSLYEMEVTRWGVDFIARAFYVLIQRGLKGQMVRGVGT